MFDQADFRVSHPNLLFLARANTTGYPRLGIVVAKRNARKATERNRIKRLIRESFRLRQHQLPHLDVIVLARRDLDTLNNATISKILKKQWQRLSNKSKATPNTGKS
ncbi:ribonuclease P protein component [Marinibactrum halimedae]|nr:ribonuclease P protein component [Marinibactrum halimedae]